MRVSIMNQNAIQAYEQQKRAMELYRRDHPKPVVKPVEPIQKTNDGTVRRIEPKEKDK